MVKCNVEEICSPGSAQCTNTGPFPVSSQLSVLKKRVTRSFSEFLRKKLDLSIASSDPVGRSIYFCDCDSISDIVANTLVDQILLQDEMFLETV